GEMGVRILHRPRRARRRRGNEGCARGVEDAFRADQGARFLSGGGAVTTRASRATAAFDATPLANRAAGALRAYDPGHDLPELRKRFGDTIAELGSNENPL